MAREEQLPTVLLAVSPRILQDALARVLQEIRSDTVCVVPRPGDVFDAAIVSRCTPAHTAARVILRLPPEREGTRWRIGIAHNGKGQPARHVEGLRGLMNVLDEYVPVVRPRAAGLAALDADVRRRDRRDFRDEDCRSA